jgi:hypothetical protein
MIPPGTLRHVINHPRHVVRGRAPHRVGPDGCLVDQMGSGAPALLSELAPAQIQTGAFSAKSKRR